MRLRRSAIGLDCRRRGLLRGAEDPVMHVRDPAQTPRLVALATAHPRHVLPQDDVARRGADLFATTHGGFEKLAPVYRNAEIDTRHSCVPIDWYLAPHTFGERNDLFLENGVALLREAAKRALDDAGLTPGDIDVIV